jgi:hypothetical protein
MKDFLTKAILSLLAKVIDQYITEENVAEWEAAAKKFAYEKLQELAKSTDWTEIDDVLVEKIGDFWKVK